MRCPKSVVWRTSPGMLCGMQSYDTTAEPSCPDLGGQVGVDQIAVDPYCAVRHGIGRGDVEVRSDAALPQHGSGDEVDAVSV